MNNNNYYYNTYEKYDNIFYYEVCFKCTSEVYMSLHRRVKGDMVIVHGEKGYNVGFVYREVLLEELNINKHEASYKFKKILSHLIDADLSMKTMLQSKILAENYALSQCKLHMRGHKLSVCADAVATEFQFDRKKLTVYLKKYEEISVCRLVRRLYDTFKMRIKVIEVDNVDLIQEKVWRYLDVSQLDITFNEVFSSTSSSTPTSSLTSSTTTSISSTPTFDNQTNQTIFLYQDQSIPGVSLSSSLPSSITTSPSTTTTSSPTSSALPITGLSSNNNNSGWNQNIANIPYLSQQQPQIFLPQQQLPPSQYQQQNHHQINNNNNHNNNIQHNLQKVSYPTSNSPITSTTSQIPSIYPTPYEYTSNNIEQNSSWMRSSFDSHMVQEQQQQYINNNTNLKQSQQQNITYIYPNYPVNINSDTNVSGYPYQYSLSSSYLISPLQQGTESTQFSSMTSTGVRGVISTPNGNQLYYYPQYN